MSAPTVESVASLLDRACAEAVMPTDRQRVCDLFWDVEAWHDIWSGVESVTLCSDDGRTQEFTMTVFRNGRHERVRTVRRRRAGGDIEFFSPDPPPGMLEQRGEWCFEQRGPSTRVIATRDYALEESQPDSGVGQSDRRRHYQLEFSDRLGAILQSFTEYFTYEHRVKDGAPEFTRCAVDLVIPHSEEVAGSYLRDVDNLPAWTTFYTGSSGSRDGRALLRTVLGSTVPTRVENPHRGMFVISSLTPAGEERAILNLHPLGTQCLVRFSLWLRVNGDSPEVLAGRVREQQGRMRVELAHLGERVGARTRRD